MAINPTELKILKKLIHHNGRERLVRLVRHLQPTDMAELLTKLSPAEMKSLVAVLLASPKAGEILNELPDELLRQVLGGMSDQRLSELVGQQPSDVSLSLVAQLEDNRQAALLILLPPDRRAVIERQLRYPEGTAGAMMTSDVLALKDDSKARDAIEEIRRRGRQLEAIFYLYVVDCEDRLKGVISLRQLIMADDDTRMGDLMVSGPISVTVGDAQESVAALISRYDFLALPVVDNEGRLVGVVTVDDVIDVIYTEAAGDMYQMAGLETDEKLSSPLLTSVRRRLLWTLINLGTAFGASAVVGFFENSISRLIALATFMPVVAGLGGNSGTQSLTVMVRSLTLGEVDRHNALRAIFRQWLVGLCVGSVAGLLTSVAVLIWKGNPMLGLVLLLAMQANMALGALAGAAVPLALKLLRQDPAMGSGILVTGFTDSFGFLAFLGLATLFLRYLTP